MRIMFPCTSGRLVFPAGATENKITAHEGTSKYSHRDHRSDVIAAVRKIVVICERKLELGVKMSFYLPPSHGGCPALHVSPRRRAEHVSGALLRQRATCVIRAPVCTSA